MSRALHSPWQCHVPRIDLSLTHWLTDPGSLTQKLKNHCQHFSVQRINQLSSPLSLSETTPMQLPRGRSVLQRQVVLICDGVPAVFAHTVTPMERVGHDWPFFNQLGNRALGVALGIGLVPSSGRKAPLSASYALIWLVSMSYTQP